MKKILYILTISIISTSLNAQKQKLAKADKAYNDFAYIDAIKTYERLADKGYKSVDLFQNLANSYYFKADLDNAAKWYTKLFEITKNLAPEYYFRYAQSLKATKAYDKASAIMEQFNTLSQNDSRAKLAASQKDYLEIIAKNSNRYTVENAGINSKYSDYGSTVYDNKLIFASTRSSDEIVSKKQGQTGENYTNLYQAERTKDMLGAVTFFSKQLSSKFNESTPVFTKDGKTVYFTRNNFFKGKKGVDADKTTKLKIFRATLNDKQEWTNITPLPFNSDLYNIAHPALSPDEKTLYFASDMPGTKGQSDIFKVSIDGDTYGTPENLGATINTESRETFPFITSDNELYFASDGHPGLGGLDMFLTKILGQKAFGQVINIGAPVNSPKDDFALWIDSITKTGYFTSNREGGIGGDDIYKFTEIKPLPAPCEQTLEGTVTDATTGAVIANAKVTLSDNKFEIIKTVTSDAQGNFYFGTVDCDTKYYIKTEATDYNTSETVCQTGKITDKKVVPIVLDKTVQTIKPQDDLAKTFRIKLIYFDLDKATIRKDAALELAKILDVLNENPTMTLDIRAHTDSRQTSAYNLALSERRAKATMQWLVKNGVNKKRLTAKGYGESQLLNNCADGVECTEEQHQENRRSEFIITQL